MVLLFPLVATAPVSAEEPGTSGEIMTKAKVSVKPSCDNRYVTVNVTVSRSIQFLGWDVEGTDLMRNQEYGNQSARTYPITFPAIKMGTQNHYWVLGVLDSNGNREVIKTPAVSRPTRATCVVKHDVQLNSYKARLNRNCPSPKVYQFKITVSVAPGYPGYILKAGKATIKLKNGAVIKSTTKGYLPTSHDQRRVEYYIAVGNKANLAKYDDMNVVNNVVASSGSVKLVTKVKRQCVLDPRWL